MNTSHTTCLPRRRAQRAFTLVEILVVIAVSVILLGLIFAPLIQTLQLTRRAQMLAAAQDSARKVLETVTRELNSAVFVYDNNSHPFAYNKANLGPGQNDTFTNFLNLDVPTAPGTNPPNDNTVAHAYNCKLDFVPARHNAATGLTDPTDNDQPIRTKKGANGGASLSTTGLLFPLAPGSTIIRYFVGLKQPIKPDGTDNPYSVETGNTYVLYRVQVTPYAVDTSGKPAKNSGPGTSGDNTIVNEKLFAPKVDSTDTPILPGQPELDDPDFFRFVTAADINWLDPQHRTYGSTPASEQNSVAQHNDRVNQWTLLVKPLIGVPTVDLLLLPRDYNGNIVYDSGPTPVDAFPNVPNFDVATDPVTGTVYPTVKTSVNFAPATVVAEAAPATTTEYTSLGVPADAVDNGGLPYIPTVYTAASQSWAFPYTISLYEYAADTAPAANLPYFVAQMYSDPADIVEFHYAKQSDTTPTPAKPVYDVTTGTALDPGTGLSTDFVPMVVNPDTGKISFAVPALPLPTTDPQYHYERFWIADPAAINSGTLQMATGGIPGQIDLTLLTCPANDGVIGQSGTNTSPLPPPQTIITDTLTAPQVRNAHVVPGSVRVYGPDATPGPNLGKSVLYTLVSANDVLGFNQYRVDYASSTLSFGTENGPGTLPTGGDPVKIAFDYQANLSPTDPKKAVASDNPAQPMIVKTDYQTRDLLQVNIGVRVYDAHDGTAFLAPASGQAQIGNSNR